jgi:hypothetical protein
VDLGRVLCCSSIKDYSGHSPFYRQSGSDRRAPNENPCAAADYTSHRSGALYLRPFGRVATLFIDGAPEFGLRAKTPRWTENLTPRPARNASRSNVGGRKDAKDWNVSDFFSLRKVYVRQTAARAASSTSIMNSASALVIHKGGLIRRVFA